MSAYTNIPVACNTVSKAYRKFRQAGFSILDFSAVYDSYRRSLILNAAFKCVCHREEILDMELLAFGHPVVEREGNSYIVDFAQLVENAGAVSRKHLEEDGFSPADIDRIRRVYEGNKYAQITIYEEALCGNQRTHR